MDELKKEHAALRRMLADLNAAFIPTPAAVKAAVAQTEKVLSMVIEQMGAGHGEG